MLRFARRLRFGCHLAVLTGLIAAGSIAARADDEAHADGWRRTATGWERREDWNRASHVDYSRREYFHRDEPNQPATPRWDFHPAVLVVLQGVAIAAAFAWSTSRGEGFARLPTAEGGESRLRGRERHANAA